MENKKRQKLEEEQNKKQKQPQLYRNAKSKEEK